jgi:hypothetical protein
MFFMQFLLLVRKTLSFSLMHFMARSATQVMRKSMRVPHLNFKILAKPFR